VFSFIVDKYLEIKLLGYNVGIYCTIYGQTVLLKCVRQSLTDFSLLAIFVSRGANHYLSVILMYTEKSLLSLEQREVVSTVYIIKKMSFQGKVITII
jgi:hypothetical protein